MSTEFKNIMLMSWIVGDRCYAELIIGGDLHLTEDLMVQNFPDSLRDKHITTKEVERFCDTFVWEKSQQQLKKSKKRRWTCSSCSKTIQKKIRSVQCDRCLSWSHFECSKIKKKHCRTGVLL